ncbi:hypothetical protein LUZ60_007900 [Juncus effusus]|nr:hypothetical protein LUZ60_007900 [Juncus effusus]
MAYFPEEVTEHIFSFLTSAKDRNSVSLVSTDWYSIERISRRRLSIGNCYSISPLRVLTRFPSLRVLSVKGKPHFADFDLVPQGWGGSADPWIEAMARGSPLLEEIRFKRMVLSDRSLDLLSKSFPNFKSLILVSCEGFSTDGLASIASHCSKLKELDLHENEIEDRGARWISCFPDSFTSLESLNFSCLRSEPNQSTLESLTARCRNLRSLRLNRTVQIESLVRILTKAPQLTDLGTGSFVGHFRSDSYQKLLEAFKDLKDLKSLSGFEGFWFVRPGFLNVIYPVCENLLNLNLSCAPTILGWEIIQIVQHCTKLQKLWVLDKIGDKGLEAVASSCKYLEELRVFPSYHQGLARSSVTELGLLAISAGCKKLNSLLYFCCQMTNAALETVAKNCPNFIRFRLCILDPGRPDPVTNRPLDEGFGAVVRECRNLRRLSLSGLLTDRVFLYIGMYAERVEMLSVAFAGESDKGMMYVLNGCKNLRKLEIRNCPFGDVALLHDVSKYESMRSLWMSSCDVTLEGCKLLAVGNPSLKVEVINDIQDGGEPNFAGGGNDYNSVNSRKVEKFYVYRSIDGPRFDKPDFVDIL